MEARIVSAVQGHRKRKARVHRLDASQRASVRDWIADQTGVWVPEWASGPLASNWRAAYRIDAPGAALSVTCVCASKRDVQETAETVFPAVHAAHAALADLFQSRRPLEDAPAAHIVYMPHRKKRTVPASAAVTPSHINGGMTTFGAQPADHPWRVLVYRKEDATKVIIHELVHLFELDGQRLPQWRERAWLDAVEPRLVTLAPPLRYLNMHEAITETLACYVYTVVACKGKRVGACCQAMGHHLDGIAKMVLARGGHQIVDGTHAFAYILGRAILWDGANGPCREFFEMLQRQHPNRDGAVLDIVGNRLPAFVQRMRLQPGPGASDKLPSVESVSM